MDDRHEGSKAKKWLVLSDMQQTLHLISPTLVTYTVSILALRQGGRAVIDRALEGSNHDKDIIALAVIFLLGTAAVAALPEPSWWPDPLTRAFMTIEATDHLRTGTLRSDLGDQAVQSWKVDLNLDALTAIKAPDGTRLATARSIAVSGVHLDLPVPGRASALQLNLDTVHEGYGGVITYAGIIDGDDGSLVAISVDGDEILGKIHHSEGFTYLLESAPQGTQYYFSVIDQTRMVQPRRGYEDHVLELEDNGTARPWEGKNEPILPMSSGGNVRVLFMYTPATAQQTNVLLLANNIISSFNTSLATSGVDSGNYLTLAGLKNIQDDQFERCKPSIMYDMHFRREVFANLNTWMENDAADIGLLIVTTEPEYSCTGHGRYGGLAWRLNKADVALHPSPFAMTTHTFAMGDLTALHEIGHVLGGVHEDCPSLATLTHPYACGYQHNCQWQTMMGGYVDCPFDPELPLHSQSAVRIARWSNSIPSYTYGGEPTGNQDHDMAGALNDNMPYVAGWMPDPPPPPSAPNPSSADSLLCFGMNLIQWTAQSGATEYRLFQSDSPSFSSPFLVYSGPGTSTLVNVTGTAWLRAKACNPGGCSADSQQVTAYYQSWCS